MSCQFIICVFTIIRCHLKLKEYQLTRKIHTLSFPIQILSPLSKDDVLVTSLHQCIFAKGGGQSFNFFSKFCPAATGYVGAGVNTNFHGLNGKVKLECECNKAHHPLRAGCDLGCV